MTNKIHPDTHVGLVSLSIADLERSLAYYQQHIGLAVQARNGSEAVLGAGDLAMLKLIEKPGAKLVKRATGLYHFALLVPSRRALGQVLRHFVDLQTPVGGASDHLVSEALYLSDPDGHGIEIYRDRPRSAWYDDDGNFHMDTKRMDVEGVLAAANGEPWTGIDPGTKMGHIHLQVADVAEARRFYTEILGFGHMTDYPSATFLSAGGYHHHLGMNSWMGAGAPPPPDDAARLLSYEIRLPDQAALEAVVERVKDAGIPINETEEGWRLQDPSQNMILLRVND